MLSNGSCGGVSDLPLLSKVNFPLTCFFFPPFDPCFVLWIVCGGVSLLLGGNGGVFEVVYQQTRPGWNGRWIAMWVCKRIRLVMIGDDHPGYPPYLFEIS